MDSQAWEDDLVKVRRQNNDRSLPAARKPAQLLESLETALDEQKTPATPTAHLAALATVLQQLVSATATDETHELVAAGLYLLAVTAPHVPAAVLRIKADDLLALLTAALPALVADVEKAPALKSLLGAAQPLFAALSDKSKRLKKPDAAQLFNTFLPLLSDARPKVRRRAHELAWGVVFPPESVKRGEQHPYAERAADHVVRALTSAAKDARSSAGKKDGNAHASTKHEDAIARLNALCAFVKGASAAWPVSSLPSLLAVVLSLPRLQSPYLSRASYDILELLLDPNSSSPTSGDTISGALEALLALRPPPTAVVVLPGWLGALETVMNAYARIDQQACAAIVLSHLEGCLGFCASAVDSDEVRTRAEKTSRGLVRWCVPESELPKVLDLVAKAMKDLRWKGRGLPHVLGVLAAVVSRCRTMDKLAARTMLADQVKAVGTLRAKKHFEYRDRADEVIGAAVEVGGPRWLLDILPLNLVTNDGHVASEGRAWLLPILRGHITNTELGHFVTTLVPLCESIFNLRAQALQAGKTAEVEAKVYEALVEQVWALLPGYCDLPTDLPTALTRTFAELLANVLYAQPNLRPVILRALQVLVEKNKTLAASTGPADSLRASFGLDAAAGKANIVLLAGYAPNLLAVMFNVFGKAGREGGGFVLECIATYLGILSAKDLSATYSKVVDLFRRALTDAAKMSERRVPGIKTAAGAEPPSTHTMIDLLVTLAPFADQSTASSLFGLIRERDVLYNADFTVQKKAYRVLIKLCDSPTGVIAANLSTLVEELASDDAPRVAGAAKRYRTELLARLVKLMPADQLHFLPTLLPEAVLATKEANAQTREAGFELVVLMAQKMDEGGVIKRSLIKDMDEDMTDDAAANLQEFFVMVAAGLAGSSPHMISATITALSRLLFEHHARLPADTLSSLLTALLEFLRVSAREIIRSALGFWKVAVVCLSADQLDPHLGDLVTGLLTWSSDTKNHFKLKVRHIFERLLRKCGLAAVEAHVPEADRKFVTHIRKSQQRAKRKKASAAAAGGPAAGEDSDDAADAVAKPRAAGQSAFDDALYGSESEMESDDEGEAAPAAARSKRPVKDLPGRKGGKVRAGGAAFLEDEGEDEPMDLLDAEVRALDPSASSRQRAAKTHFKTDELSGKMLIDGEGGAGSKRKATDADADATAAYLEAIEGEDGFYRDAKGRLRVNKKRTRPTKEGDEVAERLEDLDVGARPAKKKKARAEPERIGAEFKAKRAGGDVSKNGVSPYAYVPLSAMSGRKKGNAGGQRLAITNRKAGKGHGTKGARRA